MFSENLRKQLSFNEIVFFLTDIDEELTIVTGKEFQTLLP